MLTYPLTGKNISPLALFLPCTHFNVPISVRFPSFSISLSLWPAKHPCWFGLHGHSFFPIIQFSRRKLYTHTHTESSFLHLPYLKACLHMGTRFCTMQGRAAPLPCPCDGSSSNTPPLQVRVLLMSEDLTFHFSCVAFQFSVEFLHFYSAIRKGRQTIPVSEGLSAEVKAIFAWDFVRDLNYLLIWWNINNRALHSVSSLVTMTEKRTHKNQYRLSYYSEFTLFPHLQV